MIKRIFREDGAAELRSYLHDLAEQGETLITSRLTDLELRRALLATGVGQPKMTKLADDVLAGIHLVPLTERVLQAAGALPPPLRTLDAIHAASARVTAADVVVGYDQRLLAAVQQLGIATVSPGAD